MCSRTHRRLLAPLALAAGSLSGCGLLKTVTDAPGKVASATLGSGAQPPAIDQVHVQTRLMRFADLFAVEIAAATREFARRADSPEGNLQALTWRLDYTNALWRLASGPRPLAAMFDALVVITALRASHEDRWLPQWGEADRVMLEALVRLEEAAWSLADEMLDDRQLEEVRAVVAEWMEGDTTNRVTDLTRLPGFADMAESGGRAKGALVGELTELMRVDPLSGLEPAVREVAQARQFAERAFYFLQRMPELLSARVELLVQRSVQGPEVAAVLAGWQRVSEASTSLSATAEALPAQVSAEREAAIAQIASELETQRAGLVRDLETAEQPLRELLEGTRAAAEAGRSMSDSLTETLRVLDAFVGRFDSPEPQETAPAAAPVAASTESAGAPAGRPFDIVEYGVAAERIGLAARELGVTIATLDRSLPEVQRVVEEAAARGERTVDHAFARALQLLAAALAGLAVTVLFLRWSSRRGSGTVKQ